MDTVSKIVGIALTLCCFVPLYTTWCIQRAGGDIASGADRFFITALALCGASMLVILIVSK